ncbi:MAG: ammonium transporter, partial [Candidatus Delongbacteria bacterium]|nr:ammonium transporter [Candidatus Delongbacteria bacterium]
VIFALSGSTLATYIMSVWLRGKINIADIALAALAGGVAIGATVDFATHPIALLIGVIAGALSTAGFALLQERQQKALKAVDTCGVTNLHGLPGLMGGLAAIFVVKGINVSGQVIGILFTIVAALITGYITGKIISLFGHRKKSYEDKLEFEDC